jgi:uncharacterized protein with FMN-binding domain
MDASNGSKNKQLWAGLVVLVVIALIVGGGAIAAKRGDDESSEPTSAQLTDTSATTSSTTASVNSTATYKDGTYTASGSYNTPGGRDAISLHVIIKNGIVSTTSAQTTPPDRESEQFDQNFIDAYKNFVVGKSLGQVQVNRVAGASLTTQGFNNALQQIANQAKG